MKHLVSAASAVGMVAASLGSVPAAAADVETLSPGTLSVCLYPGFPPVAIRDADGTWKGLDVRFLTRFADAHGLSFEAVPVDDFAGIWLLPGQDACDVAGSGITRTEERVETSPGTVWSNVYFRTLRSFAVREADKDRVNGVADFVGHTVIVTKGSTAELDLRRQMAAAGVTDIDIQYAESDAQAAAAVLKSEAFAFGSGSVSTEYYAKELGGLAVVYEHRYLTADGRRVEEPFSFVVRAASDGLVEALNAFIAANADLYLRGG